MSQQASSPCTLSFPCSWLCYLQLHTHYSLCSLSGPCVSPSLPLDGTHSHQGKSSSSIQFNIFSRRYNETSILYKKRNTIKYNCLNVNSSPITTSENASEQFGTSSCNPNTQSLIDTTVILNTCQLLILSVSYANLNYKTSFVMLQAQLFSSKVWIQYLTSIL